MDDYEFLQNLGRGVCSTVILARLAAPPHSSPRVLFAIKSVVQNKYGDQIRREVAALNNLPPSDTTISLLVSFEQNSYLYLVFRPLLGGPLHKHFRAKSFTPSQASFYAAEVLKAVEHLHTNRFMHRDIKASNVLLDEKGHAVLIDFGCCRAIETTSTNYARTFCGTLFCMAPEMISKSGHNQNVDFWSVGILIYEMIAGKPPFGYGENCSQDELEIIINGGVDNLEWDAKLGGDSGSDAKDIVSKLLRIKATDRLVDFAALKAHKFFRNLDVTQVPQFNREVGHFSALAKDAHDEPVVRKWSGYV